jgi:hypothetical protein
MPGESVPWGCMWGVLRSGAACGSRAFRDNTNLEQKWPLTRLFLGPRPTPERLTAT